MKTFAFLGGNAMYNGIVSLIPILTLGIMSCSSNDGVADIFPLQNQTSSSSQLSASSNVFVGESHTGLNSNTQSQNVSSEMQIEYSSKLILNSSSQAMGIISSDAQQASSANDRGDYSGLPHYTLPGGWTLVWQDEFDGESLDDAAWNIEEHAPGWVNNEDQRYVKGHDQPGSNVWVADGTLIIEARKEANGDITSGRINSKKKKDWLYGKFEARAILPGGNGTWPAIWALSSTNPYGGWPKSGEIDIVEFLGKDPNEVHFTIHCDTYVHSKGNAKSATREIGTITSEYHTYGMEWGPDEIRGYVDGERYFTFENKNTGWQSWPYDSPFHWILNVAMGGWGGDIDESTFPAQMIVDYVRVWQQTEHMPEEIDGYIWTAISDFEQITQLGYVPFYKDTDRDVLAVNSTDYPDGVSLVEKLFSGDDGVYDITIKTLTENDGESSYTLLVNGTEIGVFQNPEDADSFNEKTFTWEDISLKKGDVVGLSFNAHTNKKIPEGDAFAYARGRWKSLTLERVEE